MNVPMVIKPRLPVPDGINTAEWTVLTNVIFPAAKNPEVILLAREYCRVRQLDIMKKPVNIVPQWDQRANNGEGAYVDQIWPSINEIRVTAARTGEYGGLDAPVWGEKITRTFEGRRKIKGSWQDVKVTVTFPETCAVTVYRIRGGIRCPFTSPVHWLERYGRAGGGELPSDMWAKAPFDQLQKNGEAASLRAAFPEEGPGYDESEIEGTTITQPHDPPEPPKPRDNWRPPPASQAGGQRDHRPDDRARTGSDAPPPQTQAPQGAQQSPEHSGGENIDAATGEVVGPQVVTKGEEEGWIDWAQRFLARVTTAKNEDEIKAWGEHNKATLDVMQKPNNEGGAPKVYDRLQAAVGKHRMALAAPPKKEGDVTIIGAG